MPPRQRTSRMFPEHHFPRAPIAYSASISEPEFIKPSKIYVEPYMYTSSAPTFRAVVPMVDAAITSFRPLAATL